MVYANTQPPKKIMAGRITIDKQQGIALFQVLLITAVISIMAIQFTQTARNQLSIASTIVDRVEAQAQLRSTETELLYSLITEKRQLDKTSANVYARKWNFYGKPFTLIDEPLDLANGDRQRGEQVSFSKDGRRVKAVEIAGRDNVNITMQDQTGLLSVFRGNAGSKFEGLLQSFKQNPAMDESEIKRYVSQWGANTGNAASFDAQLTDQIQPSIMLNSLIDWQDKDDAERINGAEVSYYNRLGMPTNLPLQTYQEMRHIRGFNNQLLELLHPYVTVRPLGYINPMQSPARIMALYMPQDRVDEIIKRREIGELDIQQFENLSGLEVDETINFVTSGMLRIAIEVSVNQVRLTKELDINLQPYDKHPYIEFEIKI
ncbi:general secretion pathway protein GspK [Shewanella frigidimarina]|uniref:general secretion pathway protein GspK n=1 Tax=Shewanella frigidimarina TaxID=56812 RepID=UPI003D7A7FB9